jgi:hypothetical protein
MAYDVRNSGDFLLLLSNFLREIINSPLHHGDFHFGNILYSPGLKKFALVDLHNVSIGKLRNQGEKAAMLQILAELRTSIKPQTMLELFSEIADVPPKIAGEVIRKRLIYDAETLQKDWERRRQQFLNGYAKFSSFVNFEGTTLLVKRDKLRRNIFSPAAAQRGEYRTVRLSFPAALEQMLYSFYLSMLLVPHVPVAALAPDGTLYYPKMPAAAHVPEDREWINNYNEYLLCMGLHLEDYRQWLHCSDNQLVLSDFSSMLAAMPDRKMFLPENVNPHRWKVTKI